MFFPYHSRNTLYKKPFGAVASGEEMIFSFPVPAEAAPTRVFLILRGKEERTVELIRGKEDNGFIAFTSAFSLAVPGVYYYRFEVHFEGGIYFIGRDNACRAVQGDWLPEWQLTVYSADYRTPDWLKGGIIYHIFPDRFNRVEDGTKPRFGYLKSWDKDVNIGDSDGVYRADDFFGGNIKGVISRLDYLKSLSVTAIYFSPVFESSSNHRYDTGDYSKIDGLFGTEEEFQTLIDECNKRNIAVLLDGVFNHTGADSIYFNKFNRYNSLGAYQSRTSPYYDWYTFECHPEHYCSWWGITVVPTVKRNAAAFQKMILEDVIEKRMKQGVKGWRLDVADELSSDFIKDIRKKVKSLGDGVIIGEVWEDASTKVSYGEEREYLFGKELDGVMNYPFRNAILHYIRAHHAEDFVNDVMNIAENYPKCALDVSMTLLGTHDTVRVMNELSAVIPPADKKDRLAYRLKPEKYAEAKIRVKMAAALQYFLPGVPTVYYGDEIGMEGYEDPINRRPMPMSGDKDLLDFYIKLGKLRAKYIADVKDGFLIKPQGDAVIIYRGGICCAVNPSHTPVMLERSVFDLLSENNLPAIPPQTVIIYENN